MYTKGRDVGGGGGRPNDVEKLHLHRDDSTMTQLCDLHVYKVPTQLWRESLNNILNNVVTETVSVGIIRVPLDLRLAHIRDELAEQLQLDDVRDYVFLRSVGRSLTRLRGKQEYQLKAKHFIPPVAYAPELYILEATAEFRDAMAMSERMSQSPPLSRRTSPSHRGYYRNGYGDSDTERGHKPPHPRTSPPPHKYPALPQIAPDTAHLHPSDDNARNDPYGQRPSTQAPHDPYHRQHDHKHDPYNNNTQQQQQQQQHPYADPYGSNINTDTYRKSHADGDPHQYSRKNIAYSDEDLANEAFGRPPPLQDYLSDKTGAPRDGQPDTQTATQSYHASDPMPRPLGERSPSPRSKASPTRSAEKGRERRHDDDSGVAGLTPEEEYNRRNREEYDSVMSKNRDMQRRLESERFGLDDETEAERRRRLDDVESGNEADRRRWDADQEERKRQADIDRRKQEEEEEERRRREEREKREEEERKAREEENERFRKDEEEERRRREEEEENRRQREERDRREEEERQRNRYEDTNRFGSPAPDASSDQVRDTESARQRRRDERNQLLKDLEDAKLSRQDQEKEREELVKKAKSMQHKTTNRRNEARDMWKKKYFEEKKKTAPLEESSSRLRQDLEALHRRLMNTLEGPKEKNLKIVDNKPSRKSNYVIQCTRLQHEIEDLQRRVENARMKLTAEMKLRNQAQGELRALRAELTQKKTTLTSSRQQAPPILVHHKEPFGGKENEPPVYMSHRINASLNSF
ncbi:zinc finger CCCH domain-containing protein 13 [Aplysia californica]|uniref:Zinc finger CCCH domain-containing protein 13 n=1 Tax=Aplysia californica TaxID=6500 RepID=A0ABM1VP05_APLCA|nr:zinc finger CCCH domain-containing protein 13 [Aplysia californica]